MGIFVVNKRNFGGEGIYVGRGGGSVLGNPFRMNDESERDLVIEQYRQWLWAKIKGRDRAVCGELMRLVDMAKVRDVYLVCWCYPKSCHGDVIKSCVEWLIRSGARL